MTGSVIPRGHERKRMPSRLAVLLLCTSGLLGQSAPSTTRFATFHIEGRITRSGDTFPVLWVTFEGKSSRTVTTNDAGVYEADLPLGLWTMIVQSYSPTDAQKYKLTSGKTYDVSVYRRPPFHVDAPINLVMDISLPVGSLCGNMSTTPEGLAHLSALCAGEEFFPAPSADGVPFEVHLWGGSYGLVSCTGADNVEGCKREFATYNLLSVAADKIVYHPPERILGASGNVVVGDESGEHRADSIAFKIQDGLAIPVQ